MYEMQMITDNGPHRPRGRSLKTLDRGSHFCYKTPGSAKLTGGAPGLQIRCGAVRAVPGGFDSHALPPLVYRGIGYVLYPFFSLKWDFTQKWIDSGLVLYF